MCEANRPDVIAGHLLPAADVRPAAPARLAFAARDDRRDDHRAPGPALGAGAGGDHAAGDLVPERERQRVIEADAVVEVAEIGVADAAAGISPLHGWRQRANPLTIGALGAVISQR
jgi:hypothetical protein